MRRELRDEMQDIVSASDYQRIQLLTMFGSRRVEGVGARASDCIVNAQNELAFRKHRLRAAGKDPAGDPLIAGWRDEIRRLRAS
jgi:hypothetical protein